VVQLLAAGRTSVVTDPEFDAAFYRLAGFRVLGWRAVRVDILERLADLIRPALAWKAGTGARPDGAFDGNAFAVTPAMMSILGAKAEDMEEILKGLGYRAEAKPAAEVTARLEALDRAAREAAEAEAAAKAAAEAARIAASAEAEAQVATEGTQPETAKGGEVAISGPMAEAETITDADNPESQQVAEAAAPHGEEFAQPVTEEAATEATDAPASPALTEGMAQDGANDASAAATPATENVESHALLNGEGDTSVAVATEPAPSEAGPEAEEPKPVLLWRPARFERGPRHQHHRGHGKVQHQGGANTDGNRRDEREGGNRRFQRKGKPGRFDGDGAGRNGYRKEAHDGPRKGKQAFNKPREERPVRFDPDSPFAKLAALRDQLKK
jgi:ATP-dependent RNA helicase SUPV3L1/SUV3